MSNIEKLQILQYLRNRFNNLSIEIMSKDQNNLIDLMYSGKLNGWCWQTTNTAILFMENDSMIERGYLTLSKKQNNYFHSWIAFKYNNEDYIFDPCLNIITSKDKYFNIFNVNKKGFVSQQKVYNYFLDYINNPKKYKYFSDEIDNSTNRFLEKLHNSLSSEEQKRIEKEIVIHGNDDISSPMFRNNVGYQVEFENQKIKKLIAHYYMNA